MVTVNRCLLSLAVVYLSSTSAYYVPERRQVFQFGKPSKYRTVDLPTPTFDASFPSATFAIPIGGGNAAQANITDIIGNFLGGSSGSSGVGFTNSKGQTVPMVSTSSSGTVLDTMSGGMFGDDSEPSDNSIDTSIISAHSNSGSTGGLTGHGLASPINLNQQSAPGTSQIGSSILGILQAANAANPGPAFHRRDQPQRTRASRFRSRMKTPTDETLSNDKRQATAGDILTTLGGAAASLPQLPSAPSLPAAEGAVPADATGTGGSEVAGP
ncbi:hypothetical protein CC1G_02954 [Coprinopsis cinerea okayama7|uniref:Uncharacterized protein n=1 Tax=Coprinopsis cinerea (strain Okayama-7 / 130 / ATCC MYA-4618 / FGSC 9003) TaxID=240176 RepID=A8NRV7_COPC7|nr:hypothetical protein CC1G_02954 [Coprinopsis cinerea okayama7\|eukprot:XP_001835866.1 hypothetical protein CC1G_02954 [Coprinopsis cinerea okayama7\